MPYYPSASTVDTSTLLKTAPTTDAANTAQPTSTSVVPLTAQGTSGATPTATAVSWTNTAHMTVVGNQITKTSSANAWDGSGDTNEQITAGHNGYIEWTAGSTAYYHQCGLTYTANPSHTLGVCDYMLYMQIGGALVAQEVGVQTSIGTYIVGDVLRVDCTNDTVKYYKNGSLLRTAPTAASYPLYGEYVAYSLNATVSPNIVTNNSTGHLVNLLQVKDSTGAVLAYVDNSGRITGASGFVGLRVASAISYSATRTDYIIGITSTASARTVTLVKASNVPAGTMVVIKDESGAAGTNNITIARSGTDTIDGATSKAISANYGTYTLYSDGSSKWFTI